MADKSNSSSGGIGVLGALFILFVALKLTGYIDWSWWWITCPLWAPVALLIVIGAVWLAAVYIEHLRDKSKLKRLLEEGNPDKILAFGNELNAKIKRPETKSKFTSKLHEAMEKNRK